MLSYKYLIIGGAMTSSAAIDGIRSIDEDGSIGIISEEEYKPYERPPLTKGLWHETKLDSIFLEFNNTNIEFYLNTKATKIDAKKKNVTDNKGQQYKYTKLLLATGASPKIISKESDRVIYYRYLRDYKKLRKLTEKYSTFGIIGGGFIGSEIAAALASLGKKVTMIFPEEGIGGLRFPEELAIYLNRYYEDNGVVVHPRTKVETVGEKNNRVIIKTDKGEFSYDAVIVGIGVSPNTDLAQSIGVKIDDGIKVDEYLRTSEADIYAAGDVTSFYSPDLDRSIRVEHEDNAYEQGKLAGKNMAGALKKYDHLPFFYSDLFDYGYEAVGILNPKLEVIEDWRDEYEEGIIYYLQNGIVVGVLLWNVWDQLDNARELIAGKKKLQKEELLGYLPK
ncbi:MAG: NAD(P)/FAD-dependent oxidoreductase [Candidatus Lokiarchaeota archaeon]|nr:NAD(P)/FAD-dependent oxidoreductase [Candidatus Lokiarchaeota archaeon]